MTFIAVYYQEWWAARGGISLPVRSPSIYFYLEFGVSGCNRKGGKNELVDIDESHVWFPPKTGKKKMGLKGELISQK